MTPSISSSLRALLVSWCLLLAPLGCDSKATLACRKSCVCRDVGLCTARNDECVATSDDDCEASQLCAMVGRCTAKDGACVVGSEEHCKASTWCKRLGHCSKRDGEKGPVCGK